MGIGEEQRLWMCVIVQAMRDALMSKNYPTAADIVAQRDAERWLESGSRDFDMVCGLAGVTSEKLREWWLGAKNDPEAFVALRRRLFGINAKGGNRLGEGGDGGEALQAA